MVTERSYILLAKALCELVWVDGSVQQVDLARRLGVTGVNFRLTQIHAVFSGSMNHWIMDDNGKPDQTETDVNTARYGRATLPAGNVPDAAMLALLTARAGA